MLTILVLDAVSMHDALCCLDCFQTFNAEVPVGVALGALNSLAVGGVVDLRRAGDAAFCAAFDEACAA